MPDELNDVVERIIVACQELHPDFIDRSRVRAELRAVQAATWREAARIATPLTADYGNPMSDISRACDRRARRIAAELETRAAALHPKESTDV